MDTYKVATTANSTSTMHTITKKPITEKMFSFDWHKLNNEDLEDVRNDIKRIEELRCRYLYEKENSLNEKAEQTWRLLIQKLPNAFNQTRTWTGSYATLRLQAKQRKNHKQIEWRQYLNAIEEAPYANELIFI